MLKYTQYLNTGLPGTFLKARRETQLLCPGEGCRRVRGLRKIPREAKMQKLLSQNLDVYRKKLQEYPP